MGRKSQRAGEDTQERRIREQRGGFLQPILRVVAATWGHVGTKPT